jgi:hypothetical protein
MAIVFTKQLDINKINLAYNNNTVSFYTNSGISPNKATIEIGLNIVTLYPNPSGIFFFNFKDLISTLLNVDNFTDDLNPDIETTLVYDWTNKISLTDDVVTTIELSNDTTETDTRSITWLSAFVQLRNWKRTYPANDLLTTDVALLQKKNENDYFNYHLNYWIGYPFDLTLYANEEVINVVNDTNAIDYEFTFDKISRLVFSDGRTDVSIELRIPLQTGINDLDFKDFNINLNKITDHCPNGIYLKWINSFGGWNYWLFNKGQEQTKTKELGAINNDFNNLEDTISPLISLGKSSENIIKVREQRIKDYDKELLTDLLDSAKVYLFTGVPFSKNTFNDWLEVNLTAGAFVVENPRSDLYRFDLTIEIPTNITRTL